MTSFNIFTQRDSNLAMDINTRYEVESLYIKLGKLSDQFNGELSDLFTEDGEYLYGTDAVTGRAAIAEHIQSLAGVTTRHCVMNIDLNVTDGKVITATAVAMAMTNRNDSTAIYVVDYESEFQRVKEKLLIRRHSVTIALSIAGADILGCE